MKRVSNVFKARHKDEYTLSYVVGIYRNGEYLIDLPRPIARRTGTNTISGSFAEVAMFDDEKTARAYAKSIYGYSRIKVATRNLGDYYVAGI